MKSIIKIVEREYLCWNKRIIKVFYKQSQDFTTPSLTRVISGEGGGTVLLTWNLAMSGNLQKFVAQIRLMSVNVIES